MDKSTVVIIDAAQIYEGVPHVLGLPKMGFDRRIMVESLMRELDRAGIDPWRYEWVDAALHEGHRRDLDELNRVERVFVFQGEVVCGRQKGVDALVQERLGTVSTWRETSQIVLVAGDNDYVRPVWDAAVERGMHLTLMHVEGSSSATPRFKACFDRVLQLDPEVFRHCFSPFEGMQAASTLNPITWLEAVERIGQIDATLATAETLDEWFSGSHSLVPADPYRTLAVRMSRLVAKSRFDTFEEKRVAAQAWWKGVDSVVFGGRCAQAIA